MLTQNGLRFAKRRVGELGEGELARNRLDPREMRWLRKERERMLTSEAFLEFRSQGADRIGVREAEAFFRIDDYVSDKMREQKLARIVNRFEDDPELGEAVKTLAAKIKKR